MYGGTIGPMHLVQSLDAQYGLDVQAADSARRWQFHPATDASGTAVPAIITIVLTFRLH